MEDLLDVPTVAKKLGVCVATVRREIKAGNLPAVKLGYRTQRVRPHDLESYLKKRRRSA